MPDCAKSSAGVSFSALVAPACRSLTCMSHDNCHHTLSARPIATCSLAAECSALVVTRLHTRSEYAIPGAEAQPLLKRVNRFESESQSFVPSLIVQREQ